MPRTRRRTRDRLSFGIDRLISEGFAPLTGQRVGLFTNLSAVNRELVTTYDVFRQAEAVNLAALFGPEHGFGGSAADGAAVDSTTDPRTGLPVYSLYGETQRPTAEMLDGLDVLVCDIQDIGARYYTFLWTLTHILEACGEHGVPVLVLDRPNPLGDRIDGGPLDPELASLVGRHSIPNQHALTLGELAEVFNTAWNPTPGEMDVVECQSWRRDMRWDDIGRIFVPPSPNMPRAVTAYHYPGSCLLEGTTLSEGRGTPLPFEVVGAPYVDGWALADALNKLEVAGVRFRPHQFQPAASKFAGQLCGGVQAHITDAAAYRPLVAWLHVIRTLRHLYPDDFAWLPPSQPDGLQHFDRLIGTRQARAMIDAGEPVDAITAGWADFHEEFLTVADVALRYLGGL